MLNDEVFDENGVPSGGDGVVYTWKPITTWAACYFEGNNHIVSGYYINDATRDNLGLFCCNMVNTSNLKVKDMFLCGASYVSAVNASQTTAINFKNITNLGGAVLGVTKLSGICCEGKNLENCINYATIKQTTSSTKGTIAGVACGNNISMYDNCINYGNVISLYGGYVAGVGVRVEWNMRNCQNYGRIFLNGSVIGAGGLVAQLAGGTIVDCANYGEIVGKQYVGGLCGYVYKFSEIYNCVNYGKLRYANGIVGLSNGGNLYYCKNYGDIEFGSGICGIIQGVNTNKACLFSHCINYGSITSNGKDFIFGFFVGSFYSGSYDFVNCENYGNVIGKVYSCSGMFGILNEGKDITVNMSNIVNHTKYTHGAYVLTYRIYKGQKVNISGMDIKIEGPSVNFLYHIALGSEVNITNLHIKAKTEKQQFFLVRSTANDLSLKNVFVENECKATKTEVNLIDKINTTTKIDGLISRVSFANGDVNHFYLSNDDMAGFYCDWKSGKLGLKALSGKGFYQGTVTEQTLINKGYTKKTL